MQAAEVLAAGRLGTIVKLDLIADMPMDAGNKYHGSAWRRDAAACPGGFFMDSAVHWTAALRLAAAAAGLSPQAAAVSAVATHTKPDLSAPDTVVGVVQFGRIPAADGAASNGIGAAETTTAAVASPSAAAAVAATFPAAVCPASVSISLAANQMKWSLVVVGTRGSLEVSRGGWGGQRAGYTLSTRLAGESEPTIKAVPFSGVDNEVSQFVDMVSSAAVKGERKVHTA